MGREISFIQSPSYPDFVLLVRSPEIASILPVFTACEASQRVDIAVQDWDVMFGAVLDRLSQSVGELRVAQTAPQASDSACRVQVIVLECVQSLAQLHMALKHDRICGQ